MNLQEIKDQVFSILNKDQTGNAWNEDRYNINLRTVNIEMFNYIHGLVQQYRPGFPIPGISAEVTQKISDWLSIFQKHAGGLGPVDVPTLVVDSNGIAILPEDYAHVSSISAWSQFGVCQGEVVPVTVLRNQEWDNRVSSTLLNRNIRKVPYCNFQNGYIRFMPKDIAMVKMVYYTELVAPFYDYYIDADEVVIYMPPGTNHTLGPNEEYRTGASVGAFASQSIELFWAEGAHPDFINFMLYKAGQTLRASFIVQTAETRKIQGY